MAIGFDEAGVGMNARDWYTIQNKILGMILQTFRHRNLMTVFTVPHISFIDVQARKLFNIAIVAQGYDKEQRLGFTKFYFMKKGRRLIELRMLVVL